MVISGGMSVGSAQDPFYDASDPPMGSFSRDIF